MINQEVEEENQKLSSEILSKLTGEVETDRKYLYEQSLLYQGNPRYISTYRCVTNMMFSILETFLENEENNQANTKEMINHDRNPKDSTLPEPEEEEEEEEKEKETNKEKEWSRNVKTYFEKYVDHFEFHACGTTISLKQKFTNDIGTLGNTVWDGALVLSKYLEQHLGDWFSSEKRRVIELGSGAGLVGIVASLMGAEVTLTDMHSMLDLLSENVRRNLSNAKFPPIVSELFWGSDVSEFMGPFDMILAADVIYQHVNITSLLNTILELSDQNTLILIAYETWDQQTPKLFRETAAKYFEIIPIPEGDKDPLYQKDTIYLEQLKKKPSHQP